MTVALATGGSEPTGPKPARLGTYCPHGAAPHTDHTVRQRPFAATPESELTRVGCLTITGTTGPKPSDDGCAQADQDIRCFGIIAGWIGLQWSRWTTVSEDSSIVESRPCGGLIPDTRAWSLRSRSTMGISVVQYFENDPGIPGHIS